MYTDTFFSIYKLRKHPLSFYIEIVFTVYFLVKNHMIVFFCIQLTTVRTGKLTRKRSKQTNLVIRTAEHQVRGIFHLTKFQKQCPYLYIDVCECPYP